MNQRYRWPHPQKKKKIPDTTFNLKTVSRTDQRHWLISSKYIDSQTTLQYSLDEGILAITCEAGLY